MSAASAVADRQPLPGDSGDDTNFRRWFPRVPYRKHANSVSVVRTPPFLPLAFTLLFNFFFFFN